MVNLRQICPTRKPFLLLRRDPTNELILRSCPTYETHRKVTLSVPPRLLIILQSLYKKWLILPSHTYHIYTSLVHFGHMRAMKFPAIYYISYLKRNAHSYCSC